jgi:hypothetical protein
MKARIVVALSVALALALPAAAQAGLPKTTDTLIVPAKSLGGVTLGSSSTAVTKAWGKNKQCEYQCLYEGRNPGELGSVLLESDANGASYKVWSVFITVSETIVGTTTKPNFETPLSRFKTSKGIGLGSSQKDLVAAYHGLKKLGAGSGVFAYTLKGPRESFTSFTVNRGRVSSIGVNSHPGG